ncbi:hypothetical protein M758_5G016000 [Ceratodon purpureus]|uniref:Fe-S metabolism associated domain-containing protein n=1 Tax=Ceratodon purpureus TaxID=3225 RepID=A0A8T0HXS6_CERPU|nr:hypothetical protein KC19_5G014400 [Ceratodon purpureus]KAG0615120.1 hypothetical protein M758_5G016000 [Ceratodon purpureus]
MSAMAMAMVSCPSSSCSLARGYLSTSEVHHQLCVTGLLLRRTTLPCRLVTHASVGIQQAQAVRGRDWGLGASASAAQVQETAEEELPSKLREVVQLFQGVAEQRARYQQLLYYGQKLAPLAKEFCTPENKVQGCVSQVWVVCKLRDDGRMYFEADSDSALTKGLAALLVEGLSGATPVEILKVSPTFMEKLGLQQSLTPSRSNGFLNMLRLMQKKTLEAYMGSTAAPSSSSPSPDAPEKEPEAIESKPKAESAEITTVKDSITSKLTERLSPVELEVEDVSHQHAGHAGAPRGSSETHFNVKVISEAFQGLSLVKRHRLIYGLLQEELQNGLHALSLITKTPAEVSDKP